QRLLRRVCQLLRGVIAEGLEQAESDLPVRQVRDNKRLVNEPGQHVGYRSDSRVTPIAHGLDRFYIASTCKDRQSPKQSGFNRAERVVTPVGCGVKAVVASGMISHGARRIRAVLES